jgi:aminoglycoside 2'-N-acetyltransferase I
VLGHGQKYVEFSPDRRPGILTGMTHLRTATTGELAPGELAALRRMVFEAFGDRFDEHDWEHTLGGTHVLVEEDGEPVAHGAVVARVLVAGGRELRAGYVEGVATRGDRRGWGWPRR